MENEWFEVAYINFDEAILHGQMAVDGGEKQVRKVLSEQEKERVVDMNERHRAEMKALLRSFVE